jgi:Arc/MetJ family transcription regulator
MDGIIMATNLAIDDTLLIQAQKIGGLKTKKDTVTLALKEFIQRRKQEEIIRLFGSIDYSKDYDYKKSRNRT